MSESQVPSPEAIKSLRHTLLLSGIITSVIGGYMLLDPAAVFALTGLDETSIKYIAIAILISSAVEFGIILMTFSNKERR